MRKLLILISLLAAGVLGAGCSFGTAKEPPAERSSWMTSLADAVEGHRIVQLGESGHGVAEFYTVKTDIVRHLHQKQGFDILAVEGGVAGCWTAWEHLDSWSAESAMRACFWDSWASDQAEALFGYLKSQYGSAQPLRLVGFDNLPTSQAFADWLTDTTSIAADLQLTVLAAERAFGQLMSGSVGEPESLVNLHETALRGFKSALITNKDLAPGLRRIFESRVATLAFDPRTLSRETLVAMRDQAMAELLLAHLDAEPDAKVIVWAHNAHVAKAYSRFVGGVRRQGEWVHQALGDQVYTVGIYSGSGRAFAWFENAEYDLDAPAPDSLEGRLLLQSGDVVFADLAQLRTTGDAWVDKPQSSFEWGRSVQEIIPSKMYDGVLIVRQVSPITRSPVEP